MDAEKGSAIPRYNVFTGIAKTLRILEICLALLLLSWFLTHLPFTLQVSGDYLRKLSAFLGSPFFVFAISNAIIAALVAQSGRLTTGDDDSTTTDRDRFPFPSQSISVSLSPVAVAEEVEYQKKLIMDPAESDTCTDKDSGAVADSNLRKVYRRSKSEKFNGEGEGGKKTARRKLRRSETEKARYPEDKLSNEEFQRTIEAFIAKQMRFLKEESLAIIVQEPTNKLSN